jgi:AAA+ superfamily predicted ATPase
MQKVSAETIKKALDQLESQIKHRFVDPYCKEQLPTSFFENGDKGYSPFFNFLNPYNPDSTEKIVLLLGLAPHLQPSFFNQIIAEHLPEGGDFPEFGGVRSGNHRGMLPTGETALFVLAGNDLEKRLEIQQLFSSEHWFAKKHILWLEPVKEGEPAMSGKIVIDPEVIELLTTGTVSKPRFSTDFPAEYIETEMEWGDLILHKSTRRQISEIENWINYNETLMKDEAMRKRVKPGYRVLFYGPPGTGKTLTASLLGKQTGKDVFRIDLSRVISKYIGETEKNLSRLFDKAEDKNWILFFDEADALFGKRTDIRDAHDKYANQEVSYLLQRIEAFNGVVILATNQRGNIDDAFVRRFQTIIHFPMPGIAERADLWKKSFPSGFKISEEIDWQQIALGYELSGAGIVNVAHSCAIGLLAEKKQHLSLADLLAAIRKEYIKEGRVI